MPVVTEGGPWLRSLLAGLMRMASWHAPVRRECRGYCRYHTSGHRAGRHDSGNFRLIVVRTVLASRGCGVWLARQGFRVFHFSFGFR